MQEIQLSTFNITRDLPPPESNLAYLPEENPRKSDARTHHKRYKIVGDLLLFYNNTFFALLLFLNFKCHGCDFDKDDLEMGRPILKIWEMARWNKSINSKLTQT